MGLQRNAGSRSRWAAVGAAVAVALGAGAIVPSSSASVGSGERPVYVAITPCRLMDTRPAPDTVGSRTTPIGPGETHTIQARGVSGNCNVPADAVAVVMNVAAIQPSADSFLTVFPADVSRPLAANANWIARQPPVSNAVTSRLATDGRLSFYNLVGTVHVAADVVGYYADHHFDDRYYTRAEVDAKLAAPMTPAAHTHDDRYFTEAEVAALVAGKVDKPTGTGTLFIDPAAFHGQYDADDPNGITLDISAGRLGARSPTAVCAVAQLPVPNGVRILAFNGLLMTGDPAAGMNLFLLRRSGAGSSETLATIGRAAGDTTGGNVISHVASLQTLVITNTASTSYVFRVCGLTNLNYFYGVTLSYQHQ